MVTACGVARRRSSSLPMSPMRSSRWQREAAARFESHRSPTAMARQNMAERERLPKENVSREEFWRGYMVGEDSTENQSPYQVLSSISPFAEFMKVQVNALELGPGDRVLDLGSGLGSMRAAISRPGDVQLVEFDLIREVMVASRSNAAGRWRASWVQGDAAGALPFASDSFDRILASLILSYVENRDQLMREVKRVLKPDGRFVLSALRADADMSRLFVDGANELRHSSAFSGLYCVGGASYPKLRKSSVSSARFRGGGRLSVLE